MKPAAAPPTEPAPLTAAMADILRRLPAIATDPRPVSEMTLTEARARTRRVWCDYWNAAPPRVARVEDHTVAGPGGPIGIRVYDPDADMDPVVMYIHGGGFVLGDLDTHDGIVRRLALASGLRFVSVGYRRAPEHPYPAPLNDCVAAARWVADHLRPSCFGLAGDSAGATLAFGTALTLRERGLRQSAGCLLLFGCYDRAMRGPSYATYGGGDYLLRTVDVDWFWRQYLGADDAAPPMSAAPIDAALDGLPPVFIGAAECDPLFGDSERLAQRFASEDRPHVFRVWRGLTHGCVGMARDLNAADRILADAGVWLRTALTGIG